MDKHHGERRDRRVPLALYGAQREAGRRTLRPDGDQADYRFDRMEDRIDGLTREVVANGRAIARIEGRLEGHPLAVAE